MAICDDCNQEMSEGVSCTLEVYDDIDETVYPRIRYGDPAELEAFNANDLKALPANCVDCFAPLGGYHHPGCDVERCPNCKGQAVSCECGDNGYVDWLA